MKTLDEALRLACDTGSAAACAKSSLDVPIGDLDMEFLRAAIAALAADGYVLVPREATRDMVRSDSASDPDSHRGFLSEETLAHVWRCMLAAAPKPGASHDARAARAARRGDGAGALRRLN